jgi:DNA-binding XRE family transcriptional regulator
MARSKMEYWASPEGLRQLEAWTEEKLTDVQIAANIGVSRSTLGEWKKKNAKIADALDFSEEKSNRKKFEHWMTPDGMLLVKAWARNGLTDEELATKLGIVRSTLNVWKLKYPAFADLLVKTKEIVDVTVENSSIMAATGYEYTEQQAFKVKETIYDPETGKKVRDIENVVVVDLKRWQPADIKAIIWWLKNRDKENWKERQVLELNDNQIQLLMEIIDSTEKVK